MGILPMSYEVLRGFGPRRQIYLTTKPRESDNAYEGSRTVIGFMVSQFMTSGLAAFTMESLGAHFRMPFQDNYVLWKIIGFLGMGLFFTRFFVQWLYSEKHKESKIPTIFWWQSLLGSAFMLAYSLRQQDSVYILGYLFTVIPYTRNLILIYRKPRAAKAAPSSAPPARKVEAQGFPIAGSARAVTRA